MVQEVHKPTFLFLSSWGTKYTNFIELQKKKFWNCICIGGLHLDLFVMMILLQISLFELDCQSMSHVMIMPTMD